MKRKSTSRPGRQLLGEWIDAAIVAGAGRSEIIDALAAATGKTHTAVYHWLEGRYRPRAGVVRAKLERFTGGKVPASSWVEETEAQAVAAVKPYAGKAA